MKTLVILPIFASFALLACGNGEEAESKSLTKAEQVVKFDSMMKSSNAGNIIGTRVQGAWVISGLAAGNRPRERIELEFQKGTVVLSMMSRDMPRRNFGGAQAGYNPETKEKLEIILESPSPVFAKMTSFTVFERDDKLFAKTPQGEFEMLRTIL